MSDSKKYVLIVGGAGYIGSHTNKYITQKGYETLVLDNLSFGHEYAVKWGKLIVGDIADKDLLDEIFTTYKIETVMHFSAFAFVGESVTSPQKYYQNNVVNTLNLLNTMIKHDVKKFIFSSTCATFGEPEYTPIDEAHPQNPINPYGLSKLMVEKILKDYDKAYGLKSVVLRYFNASGADPETEIGEDHTPETHLIPLVLDVAIGKREDIKVFGNDYNTPDGTCVRDYIHVNDLADAHYLGIKYLEKEKKSNQFNLGNGTGFSVMQIIDTAKKITGKNINFTVAPRREGDPSTLIGGSKKATEILTWKPRYANIEDIIQTAWNWHKKIF